VIDTIITERGTDVNERRAGWVETVPVTVAGGDEVKTVGGDEP
jgi:hypothetical protein